MLLFVPLVITSILSYVHYITKLTWKEVKSHIPPVDKSTRFLRQYLNKADRPELGAYLYFPNRPIVGNPDQKHYEIDEANQLLTNTVRRMLLLVQANPKKYDLDSLSNDGINNLINEFQRWTNNHSHHMTVRINHYITEK